MSQGRGDRGQAGRGRSAGGPFPPDRERAAETGGAGSREHDRIARLRELLVPGGGPRPGVLVDIGDDAAVLPGSGSAPLCATVDTAIEGVHFRLPWAPPRALGRRAAVAAASDLWAMGAEPRALLLALAGPPSLDDETVVDLVAGVADLGREVGAPLVGGNLSRGSEVSLTITALGELPGTTLRRDAGRAGDRLWLAGVPGSAAVGLAVLLRADQDDESSPDSPDPTAPAASAGRGDREAFIAAWRRPEPTLAASRAARGRGTSGIDLSDGLLQDLGHLTAASGVGAVLMVDALPRDPGHEAVCAALGLDPLVPVLTGGESYALLVGAPPGADLSAAGFAEVGLLRAEAGIELRDRAGRRISPPADAPGFDHFVE